MTTGLGCPDEPQITSTDGISLGSVELSHLDVGDPDGFRSRAELEVSISFSAPVTGGWPADEFVATLEIRISLSRFRARSRARSPGSNLIASCLSRLPRTQRPRAVSRLCCVLPRLRSRRISILRVEGDTLALPSEISEGDTLELTLGGLATEFGTVSVSQTIDPGETLSDVATSLVADLSGLTNDAGDPLGLSGETVSVCPDEPPDNRRDHGRSSGHAEHRSDGRVCGDVGDPDARRFPVSLEAPSLRCRSRVAV